jgi:hypothetical protein
MGFLLYSHESPVRYAEYAVTFTNLRCYSFGDGADLSGPPEASAVCPLSGANGKTFARCEFFRF